MRLNLSDMVSFSAYPTLITVINCKLKVPGGRLSLSGLLPLELRALVSELREGEA